MTINIQDDPVEFMIELKKGFEEMVKEGIDCKINTVNVNPITYKEIIDTIVNQVGLNLDPTVSGETMIIDIVVVEDAEVKKGVVIVDAILDGVRMRVDYNVIKLMFGVKAL